MIRLSINLEVLPIPNFGQYSNVGTIGSLFLGIEVIILRNGIILDTDLGKNTT